MSSYPKFKKYELCNDNSSRNRFLVILSDEMEVPYFHDGVASNFAFTPLDIENPDEWKDTFPGYLVWDILEDRYDIVAPYNLRKWSDETNPKSWIPFDIGTGRLRSILGLLKLSDEWSEGRHSNWLESHLKNYKKKEKTDG